VARDRVLVAGNGVRLDRFPRLDRDACRARLGLPRDAFVMLFLGRKVYYKGVQTTLQALRRLRDRYPTAHLVTAGPAAGETAELMAPFRGLDRWLNLDEVSETQKIDLLNACDVLLLPSTGEAFGIVFLEAWAVGKPVIGARAGAIPWVIDDGTDGFLADPTDGAAWAAAVERLIVAPELAQRLGEAGHAKVRGRYSVQRITDVIEDGYRAVLERRAAASVQPRIRGAALIAER
jgi:glycosyltransferase involved in cell wall biosynthesis